MPGVLVNCGAIIIGSIIGVLFAKKISEEMSSGIMTACGVVTLVLGFQMAFKYHNIVFMTLSLIIGGVIGTLCDIDGKILYMGKVLEKITKVKKTEKIGNDENLPLKSEKNFAYAFLNASVLFCVGSMAIVGSIQAGIQHNYTTLFTKAILDGFMAISFASVLGIGTAFSAIMIFIYQGLLTELSVFLSPYVNDLLMDELCGCGGVTIIMIGLNILGIKKIKTANFLPALVIQILFVELEPLAMNLIKTGKI